MKLFLPMFLLLSGLLICTGCSNVKVPDYLKNLCPVTITVTDGGLPMDGVAVILSSKGSQGAFACTGVTDAKGIAQIYSSCNSYTGKGTPAGTYSVVLIKTVDLPVDLVTVEEIDMKLSASEQTAKHAKQEAFLEKNRLIPKILESSETSPVDLTVTGKTGIILTVDIAQYKK
ncbi:MAG: Ig-like domain-containing protein [Planctomycetaceae bacterium]|nr:Ig-like domain-containing protein [Planctomycetaceae bacterium]